MSVMAYEQTGFTLGGVAVTDDSGVGIRQRRERLHLSVRKLAEAASVDRASIASAESGRPVRTATLGAIVATLDRLERDNDPGGTSEVTNVIELPDGTRVTFVGSAENVVEAASRFLSRRKD